MAAISGDAELPNHKIVDNLTALGLSSEAAALYIRLLAADNCSIDVLASEFGLLEVGITAALDSLVENGLIVRPATGGAILHTVAPHLGLARLVDGRSEQLRRAEDALSDARRATEQVIEMAGDRNNFDLASLEVVDGRYDVTDRIGELVREADHEVMSMLTELPTPAALDHARSSDAALLARGISSRILALDGHLNGSAALSKHLHVLRDQGAAIGIAAALPTRMLIIDRRTAVLPRNLAFPTEGAVIVRQPVIISLLIHVFEKSWLSSRPLVCPPSPAADLWAPTDLEHEVILLLASGNKDEAIARRVGLSLRSVRRLIAGISSAVNTRSRFELGAQCSELGWSRRRAVPTEAGTPEDTQLVEAVDSDTSEDPHGDSQRRTVGREQTRVGHAPGRADDPQRQRDHRHRGSQDARQLGDPEAHDVAPTP